MRIVLSLGGSFIHNKTAELSKLKEITKDKTNSFVIVCGGGKLCRDWISFAEQLKLPEKKLHEVGIRATLLNAFIIAEYLGGTFFDGDPLDTPNGRLVISGGFKPGDTTDVDAANAAIVTGTKVVFNISKERGVYDKDPEKFHDAKLLKKIGFKELYALTKGERKPGMNFIFDPRAAKICEEKGIKVVVTDNLEDILSYIKGKGLSGTLIS